MVALLNPLDCLRVRWQMETASNFRSMWALGAHVVQTEGLWVGLWRPALLTNASSIAVSGGLRLGFYPIVRDALGKHKTPVIMFTAGLATGAAGYAISCPIFRLKTKMQAEAGIIGADGVLKTGWRAGHAPEVLGQGLLCGLRTLGRGGVTALWRGGGVLAARGALLSAGQLLGYDGTKTEFRRRGVPDGPALHVVASVAAAFLATTFAAPADVLMANFQTSEHATLRECAASMLHHGGPAAFLRGWSANFARLAPLFALYLPIYEQIRLALGIGFMS